MTSKNALRLFTNGGILSPEELRKIIQVASACGCESISPGLRQELHLPVTEEYLSTATNALEKNTFTYAPVHHIYQNIVTSFAALQILPATPWLLGDTYLDILDSFTYQPRLKINIVDPLQNLVPLFTGELNFIASAYPRYWHLYIHVAGFGKKQVWPVLIDGDDIGSLSWLIEEVYVAQQPVTMQALYLAVSQKFTGRTRSREEELHLPLHQFPVIEGIHHYGGSYWLGIYRRSQSFPLGFLEALYELCIVSKIGNICLTPHKTLLIKDIRPEDLLQWQQLLGMHQINIQHSASELKWQLPDLDTEAIQLKNTWVGELEEKEVYSAGLSFAIQTKQMEVATSVMIRQKTETYTGEAVYDILHTTDFSVHALHWQLFAANVPVQGVAAALIDLCREYYTHLSMPATVAITEESPVFTQSHEVHQCPNCLTVYDPVYGDPASAISAGVSFHELPDSYTCSLCDTPKASFISVGTLENNSY